MASYYSNQKQNSNSNVKQNLSQGEIEDNNIVYNKIRKLTELHEDGILTDKEYEDKKQKLLIKYNLLNK